VDADAALDAASRTPVPRQLSSDSVARYSGGGGDPIQWRRRCPCIGDGGGGGGLIPSLAARFRIGLGFLFGWVWRLRSTS